MQQAVKGGRFDGDQVAGLADRHQRQPHRFAGAVGNDDVFRAIDTMQFDHALGDLPAQLLIAQQFVGIETTLAERPRHFAGGLLQRVGRQEIGMRHRRAQVDQVRIFGGAQNLPGQRLAGDFGGRETGASEISGSTIACRRKLLT